MAEGSHSAREKSFNSKQDEAICHAYLFVSQDPNVGINQARSKKKFAELIFFSKVLDYRIP